MEPIETLHSLLTCIEPSTLPSKEDWQETEGSLGLKLPESFKELINNFGHGVWGRDMIFLHPKGANYENLRLSNLLRLRSHVDFDFQTSMPGDAPGHWRVIPIALLPYRAQILQDLKTEEVIVYDGDCPERLNTGLIGPARFILQSFRWREVDLPATWKSLAEANWPPGMPIFTSRCRHDPEGLVALAP